MPAWRPLVALPKTCHTDKWNPARPHGDQEKINEQGRARLSQQHLTETVNIRWRFDGSPIQKVKAFFYSITRIIHSNLALLWASIIAYICIYAYTVYTRCSGNLEFSKLHFQTSGNLWPQCITYEFQFCSNNLNTMLMFVQSSLNHAFKSCNCFLIWMKSLFQFCIKFHNLVWFVLAISLIFSLVSKQITLCRRKHDKN